MAQINGYLLLALSVFAVNLLPAFGPPTWAVLVFWYLRGDSSAPALVAAGAVAAASGRLTLAWATRRLRRRLPSRYRENLTAAGQRLFAHRARSWAGLILFAVSPLPSAQLFEAAALLDVALTPLTAAFFVGRAVSYSVYLGTATVVVHRTGAEQLVTSSLASPWGVVVEVLMLAGLVIVARVNWDSKATRASERAESRGKRAESRGR